MFDLIAGRVPSSISDLPLDDLLLVDQFLDRSLQLIQMVWNVRTIFYLTKSAIALEILALFGKISSDSFTIDLIF